LGYVVLCFCDYEEVVGREDFEVFLFVVCFVLVVGFYGSDGRGTWEVEV
jgi:hypothetical protein